MKSAVKAESATFLWAAVRFKLTHSWALGAIFQLSLGIPDAVSTITIDAARVRNVRLDRVGLEFLKFQKSERERLQNLVRGLLFARRGEQKATFDEAR
jgi:hypothetical protein